MSEEQKTNEKYFEYYVETLIQTLNQQVLTNVSLQAKARVNVDILSAWQNENETLKQLVENGKSEVLKIQNDLNDQIEKLKLEALTNQSTKESQKNSEIERLKTVVSGKDNIIAELKNQVAAANALKAEHEKIKHQVTHIDTFRSQLIKLQEVVKEKDDKIEELNAQIEYLKLTPAKRKKLDEKNNLNPVEEVTEPKVQTNVVDFVEESTQETSNDTIKDGGSF